MKARVMGFITLLMLLLIPFNLLKKRDYQEINIFGSLSESSLLLLDSKKQLEQYTTLPDATRVNAAIPFHGVVVNPKSGWIDREVYIKPGDLNSYRADAKNEHQIFIEYYAILPEGIQQKDFRRKRKRLSTDEFNNDKMKGGNTYGYAG